MTNCLGVAVVYEGGFLTLTYADERRILLKGWGIDADNAGLNGLARQF